MWSLLTIVVWFTTVVGDVGVMDSLSISVMTAGTPVHKDRYLDLLNQLSPHLFYIVCPMDTEQWYVEAY